MVSVNWKKLSDKLTDFEESAAQISILIVTLVFYLLTKHPIFGILVTIEFIAFVALEIGEGIKKHGIKFEILDTLRSLGIAVLLWLSISVILRTSVPVSAVVSCSMLPNLQRGDLTIIRGISVAELHAPELQVSESDLIALFSPKTQILSPYRNFTINGSLFSYCQMYKFADQVCKQFYSSPSSFSERRGSFEFRYSQCNRKVLGSNALVETPCVTSLIYKGSEYKANFSNDIIVYQPNNGDLFSYTGDIIHRVYVKIKSGEKSYVLTKGDNNNVFDIQFYDYQYKLANTPVQEKNVRGVNLFAIPYIGYFKLFISGFVSEPAYCNTNLIY